jgi:phage shock protein A
MGIISRAVHVGRSHLNSAVTWASNPEKRLRLLIQDMEETLVKARSSAIRSITEKKELERRVAKLRAETQDWQSKAELALRRNREDLASEALQAKARNASILATLEDQLERLVDSLQRQGQDMAGLQNKLQEAKARERANRTLHRTATTRLWLRRKTYDQRIDTAMAQLGEVEDMLDELEGKVESYDLGRTAELSGTLNRLAIESSASAELEELRTKIGQQQAISHEKA